MLMLVQIDLSNADVAVFDEYEGTVLGLLGKYGARLEDRLRTVDDRIEIHLLHFPDAEALAAFRSDPIRMAAQTLWERSGATSSLTEVTGRI